MNRHVCRRLLPVVFLAGGVVCASSAWTSPFAAEGAQGVLEFDVTVVGSGDEPGAPGSSWKSRHWSVEHSGTYRLAMVASSAIIEGEDSGAADEAGDFANRDAYWEQKTEACNGDPTCEMSVAMEQMQSPEAQALMQGMGEAISAAQMGTGNLPNAQSWRIASRSGSVRMEQHDDVLGVISETGGGLVDVLCKSTIDQALDPEPAVAFGPAAATITIDGNSAKYRLMMPLEESFMLKRNCTSNGDTADDPSGNPAPLLGDGSIAISSRSSELQFEGIYTGEPSAPAFEGKKEFEVSVLNAPTRKAKATIIWRFRPGVS